MPKTDKKPLELGKPRATKYMEILTKRLGKRKAAVIEGRARELAEEAGQRVVRFEFVAQAAGVPMQQMLDELAAEGIRTSPRDVRFGTVEPTNGAAPAAKTKKTPATKAPASAGKGGRGNARKATASKPSPKTRSGKTSSGPKPKPKTATGSAKRNGSSRKDSARSGRAASSSASPKTDQLRRLREQKASAAR